MDICKALAELSSAYGPSGFEKPVTDRAARLLAPLVHEAWTDSSGNLFGIRRCGVEGARRLLLDAHLDEVGMVVTGQEKGFIKFARIKNGIDPAMLPAREVVILGEKPISGVITCLPPHIQTKEEMASAMKEDSLFIDAGLSEDEAGDIAIGTPVAFYDTFCTLGEKRVSGKSLDDRACFVTILRCLELLEGEKLDIDIVVMGSTQEETGMRGATAGVFSEAPDYAVALDVTFGDSPDCDPEDTFTLGSGATIGIGPSMNRTMSRVFTELAEEKGFGCSPEVMAGSSGTNGWAFQTAREGVPTAVLSVPLRYMHTPCETVDLSDIETTAGLLAEFCRNSGRWLA